MVGFFLNFEKVSLSIIEDEINKMTDNNSTGDELNSIDTEQFEKNLYHGSIAAVFIVNLYETALNSILRKLGCLDTEILKTSHDVKLQLICAMRHIDINRIKGDHSYGETKSIIKLRNDITHFKSNELQEGSCVRDDVRMPEGTSKDSLASMFTKNHMSCRFRGVLRLLDLICSACGFVIYKECSIIGCDGRDCAYEFVLTREEYETREDNRNYEPR